MKNGLFALTCTVLVAVGLAGCSSDNSGGTPETPTTAGAAPGQMPYSAAQGGMMAPAAGGQSVSTPGVATTKGGGAPPRSSFDVAPESFKKQWGGGAAPAGPGTAGAKPSPIREGMVPSGLRKDPFESAWKPVVQLAPAWDLTMAHRTAPPMKLPDMNRKTGDPNLDLPPLPPVPRRVAGVFYNGAITAILESGNPPDSIVSIVQPGAEVESGVPGIPALTVESITMDSLILRAKDGRSVEVKLSGLSPAVLDALRQQFNNANPSGGMQGGGGTGPGGGMMGPGGMGGGGGKAGFSGGGGGAPTG